MLLPRFRFHTATFHRNFTQHLVHILSTFYPDSDILSRFLSLLLQSLTASVSSVCLHYYYHHRRGRRLHRCVNCFRRCIAVCIIVIMLSLPCCHCLCYAVLCFHLYLHNNQPTFCLFVSLYVVACHQSVALNRHMLSLLYLVTFHSCFFC